MFQTGRTAHALRQVLILAGLAGLFLAHSQHALAEQSATISWNPSPDTSVMGYCIYSREENSTNQTRVDVGQSARVVLGGLKEGLKYSFSVASYNEDGVESVPSPEVSVTVKVPVKLKRGATARSPVTVQFPAAPGKWYEVQASSDLKTWTTIWQTGVATVYSPVEFQDVQSVALKSRFYRLKVH
jgi:hypothetical protein